MIYRKSNNEYLNLYAKQNGIKEGENLNVVSYSFWIESMHNKFQSEVYRAERFDVTSESYVNDFIKWLKSKKKLSKTQKS